MPMLGSWKFWAAILFKKLVLVGIVAVVFGVIAIHLYYRGRKLCDIIKSFIMVMSHFIKCVFSPRCFVLCVVALVLLESVPKWVYFLVWWSLLIMCYDAIDYVVGGVELWGSSSNIVHMGISQSSLGGSSGGGSGSQGGVGGSPDNSGILVYHEDGEENERGQGDHLIAHGGLDTSVADSPENDMPLRDNDKEMLSNFNTFWGNYIFKKNRGLQAARPEMRIEYFNGYKGGYYASTSPDTPEYMIPLKDLSELPEGSLEWHKCEVYNIGARMGFIRGKRPFELGAKIGRTLFRSDESRGWGSGNWIKNFGLGVLVVGAVSSLLAVGAMIGSRFF